jgi:hypothetical protein
MEEMVGSGSSRPVLFLKYIKLIKFIINIWMRRCSFCQQNKDTNAKRWKATHLSTLHKLKTLYIFLEGCIRDWWLIEKIKTSDKK